MDEKGTKTQGYDGTVNRIVTPKSGGLIDKPSTREIPMNFG